MNEENQETEGNEELRKDKPWLYAADVLREEGKLAYGTLIGREYIWKLLEVYTDLQHIDTQEAFNKLALARLNRIDALIDHILETENKLLANVRSQGYMVLNPDNQVEHTVREHDKKRRNLDRKSIKRLQYINRDELSSSKITLINDFVARRAAYEQIESRHRLKRRN